MSGKENVWGNEGGDGGPTSNSVERNSKQKKDENRN